MSDPSSPFSNEIPEPTHRARLLKGYQVDIQPSGLRLTGPCTVLVAQHGEQGDYVSGYLLSYRDDAGQFHVADFNNSPITLGPGWTDIITLVDLEYDVPWQPLRF